MKTAKPLMPRRTRPRSPMEPFEALGQSEAFLEFEERLSRIAPVDRPVLLVGERGTGKELAARRLHFLSTRWKGPLVALNCSALTSSLIESELFGYERGAFTGAEKRRAGRFEAADGGTLFLDEIGNIPTEVQEKILRVVEYGVFERVGGSESVEVDVRIIAATNADLVALAEEGQFKQDLLDRLSFEVLFLPPLRERKEDILLLANHFAARMAFELGRERAVYRSDSVLITDIDFNPFRSPYGERRPPIKEHLAIESGKPSFKDLTDKPFKEAVRELEIRLLQRALQNAKYNQRKAARTLGLTYHQFRGLYRKYIEEIE